MTSPSDGVQFWLDLQQKPERMKRIKWSLVVAGATTGIVYAALTIIALIAGYEKSVALALIAGIGLGAGLFSPGAPIRNAFVAGFVAGILAILTQAVFLSTYFANNPAYAELPIPFGLDPQLYTFLSSPAGGLIVGALACLVAWPVAVFVRRMRR